MVLYTENVAVLGELGRSMHTQSVECLQSRQISYQHSGAHRHAVQSRIHTCSGSPGHRCLSCDSEHRPAHSPRCYSHTDCWLGGSTRITTLEVTQDIHNHLGHPWWLQFQSHDSDLPSPPLLNEEWPNWDSCSVYAIIMR